MKVKKGISLFKTIFTVALKKQLISDSYTRLIKILATNLQRIVLLKKKILPYSTGVTT